MGHVFISYSTHNREYAQKSAEKLRIEGFDVWIDNARLHSSDNWWQSIVIALKDCAEVVVVMTPELLEAEWVQREGLLPDEWKKLIFPILLPKANSNFFVNMHYEAVGQVEVLSSRYTEKLASKRPLRIWCNMYPIIQCGEQI
ncbi:MAG: hypothetical protein CL610_19880 [Anaerolineaceae bacterium]|nr:hypothetical protein [Anaerolineaceae bacterium]